MIACLAARNTVTSMNDPATAPRAPKTFGASSRAGRRAAVLVAAAALAGVACAPNEGAAPGTAQDVLVAAVRGHKDGMFTVVEREELYTGDARREVDGVPLVVNEADGTTKRASVALQSSPGGTLQQWTAICRDAATLIGDLTTTFDTFDEAGPGRWAPLDVDACVGSLAETHARGTLDVPAMAASVSSEYTPTPAPRHRWTWTLRVVARVDGAVALIDSGYETE